MPSFPDIQHVALRSACQTLEPASPELLEARLLNRRFDRKYLAHVDQVAELLRCVQSTHAILEAGGRRLARYSTLYFDTPERKAYHDHRRGRPRRAKVRMRDYLDRDLTFLELKRRRGTGHTLKLRRDRARLSDHMSHEERVWVGAELPWADSLEPVLTTDFLRIGLLGIDHVERATIDVAIRFSHGDSSVELGSVAIIEVKTPRWLQRGPVVDFLHAQGRRAESFSKYCIGSALVQTDLRHGSFRPALRSVGRIADLGDLHV